MNTDSSPIAAIATAPGRGGVGIVRISGKNLEPFISEFFRNATSELPLEPRYAHFLPFMDEDGNIIDEGIALYFKAPHSFTGEDVLELQGHGGPVVLQMLLKRCLQVGKHIDLRMAEPGEFTRRAFLNDRIDLAQAEAIADLIDATTEEAVRSASRSLSGAFSKEIHELVATIIELRMLVESSLDFPEEDIDFIADGHIAEQVNAILSELTDLEKKALRGKVLRDGLTVVLVGAPNVGKSSLMNALAQSEVAIVTEIAGTTRDRIEHDINLDGLLVHLIDTAGVRETDDPVEKIGVERAKKYLNNADLVIYVVDTSTALDENDHEIMELLKDRHAIVLLNKSDLSPVTTVEDIRKHLDKKMISISAKEQTGMDDLEETIKEMFFSGEVTFNDEVYITNIRHKTSLQEALRSLHLVLQSIADDMPEDFYSIDLMNAYEELGNIIGESVEDDLVNEIFSKFCMGK